MIIFDKLAIVKGGYVLPMAKVSVNKDLCIGCGLCASTCSEVFELGEDGKSHAIGETCTCDLKEVALDCPVQAITVEE
jgi:ferredoxin